MQRAPAISAYAAPARRTRTPSRRLPGFIVLSLICHLPLVLLWQGAAEPTAVPAAVRTLNLVGLERAPLESPRSQTPASHTATTATPLSPAPAVKAAPDAPQPAPAAAAVAPGSTSIALQTTPAEAPAPTPDTPAPPSLGAPAAAGEAKQAMDAYLHAALARHFFYPPLARRHGWEGVVTLAFQITPAGAIQDISVAASSGHGILDRAATDALSRVGVIDRAALGTAWREPRPMRLPVIYTLTEG